MKNYDLIKQLSFEAYEFVEKILSEGVENGSHNITDEIFANVMTYETKYRKDCCFEAHKKYIDIQLMLDGCEIISTEHIDVMHKYECTQPFGDGDTELYVLNNECVDNVISNGDFVILYPEDAHMPCVCVGKPQTVKKVVIKVPVK